MIRLFSKSKPKKAEKGAAKKKAAPPEKPATDQAVPANAKTAAPARPPANAPQAKSRRRPEREMTPERERLIRQALLVHTRQSKILDELDDDLKEKLRTLAERTLLGGSGTKH